MSFVRQGLLVFPSLDAARREGYSLYERTATGYLVRGYTERGWALAIVEIDHALGE